MAGLAIPIVIPALLYADAGRAMITPLLNFSSEFHLLDSARRWLSFALDPRGPAVGCGLSGAFEAPQSLCCLIDGFADQA